MFLYRCGPDRIGVVFTRYLPLEKEQGVRLLVVIKSTQMKNFQGTVRYRCPLCVVPGFIILASHNKHHFNNNKKRIIIKE